MSDKTFRDRINEELPNFPRLYKGFAAARQSYIELNEGQEGVLSDWAHAFSIPFESSVKDYLKQHPDAEKDLKPSTRHDAVIDAIRELGLDEIHLSGGVTLGAGSGGIWTALDSGLLEVDEFKDLSEQERKSTGITLHKPDRGDPLFWRTL